jgi:hypothetical protein
MVKESLRASSTGRSRRLRTAPNAGFLVPLVVVAPQLEPVALAAVTATPPDLPRAGAASTDGGWGLAAAQAPGAGDPRAGRRQGPGPRDGHEWTLTGTPQAAHTHLKKLPRSVRHQYRSTGPSSWLTASDSSRVCQCQWWPSEPLPVAASLRICLRKDSERQGGHPKHIDLGTRTHREEATTW